MAQQRGPAAGGSRADSLHPVCILCIGLPGLQPLTNLKDYNTLRPYVYKKEKFSGNRTCSCFMCGPRMLEARTCAMSVPPCLTHLYPNAACRWYVADGRADKLEEASTSGREMRGGAARIGRPEELFGSSQKRKRPARHRVIMLRGVVSLHAAARSASLRPSPHHSRTLIPDTRHLAGCPAPVM